MLENYTKNFHGYCYRLGIFNKKLILDMQNCTKSNHIKILIYFSNIEHHVISQLVKSELKTQFVRKETKKKNLITG